MNKIAPLGRLGAVGRWLRAAWRAPRGLLRHSLREAVETEKEFNDGLLARLQLAERRIAADPAEALHDWNAVERSAKPARTRIAALRVLFLALLAENARLKQAGEQGKLPAAKRE